MPLFRRCIALVLVAILPLFGVATSRARGTGSDRVVWKHYVVQSPATGKIERFWVGQATDLNPDGTYPVVYFLDGLLGNENEWKKEIDPHIGRHQVIAVCPSVGGATWFMNSPAQPWMRWGDFLTEELRAFVESKYPASRAKGERGIVGISAGGQGALYHALHRPDLYGSVSVLSGALALEGYAGAVGLDWWIGPRTPEALPLYTQRSVLRLFRALEKPPAFALYLDTADKDGARPQMEAFKRILDAKGFVYEWHVGLGAHNWKYWRERRRPGRSSTLKKSGLLRLKKASAFHIRKRRRRSLHRWGAILGGSCAACDAAEGHPRRAWVCPPRRADELSPGLRAGLPDSQGL